MFVWEGEVSFSTVSKTGIVGVIYRILLRRSTFLCLQWGVVCREIQVYVLVLLKCVLVFVGTVRVWHANTYRLETTLNYGLERVWCISHMRGLNDICIGYDEGSVMIKVSAVFKFCITNFLFQELL